jgi:uncharacterized membrane protein YdbT with pleckstrin-like domain
VFVAVNSPSFAPPDVANVDNKTVGREDTVGQPQSAPKLFWAKLVATVMTAIAVIAILVTSFFIWVIDLVIFSLILLRPYNGSKCRGPTKN